MHSFIHGPEGKCYFCFSFSSLAGLAIFRTLDLSLSLSQQGSMASEAPVPAAGISSLFKKKKGKKTKGSNLNNDKGLPKTE